MYFDNEDAVSSCIEQMTKEIWKVIRLVLAKEAQDADVKEGVEKAKYLHLYIDSYESREYKKMPPSSIWLAREMVEAVQDLID